MAMKNKEKYNLNKLEIKLINTLSGYKIKVFYKDKIIYERTHLADNDNKKIEGFFNWLEQEYKPPILDDVENAYLSAVIKPFRERIKYIRKINHSSVNNDQFLCIVLAGDRCGLPNFKKGTMYKGMEVDKDYTLEELGL
nr:MAG TPA: hypothetical protein [Caudoviricetes sp.]